MMQTAVIPIVALLLSSYRSANAASVNPAFVISSDRTTGRFCAGSLIHPDIVLTAATCQGVFAKGAFVGGSKLDGSDGQYHEVELEAIHPEYVEGKAENNVMLLKLKSTSDAVVQEINADSQLPIDGAEIEVLGFNRESAQSIYPFEQTNVVATKIDYATCTAKYAGYNLYIIDSHVFCSSALGSTCHGNMGSPMVDSRGRQVGIVAGGGGCDSNTFPVLNVRTSTFGVYMYQGVCALSSEPFDSCPPRPAPAVLPSASLEPSAAPSTNSTFNMTSSGSSSPTTVQTQMNQTDVAEAPTAQPSLRGSQQDTLTATPSQNSTEVTGAPTMTPSEQGYLAKLKSDIEEIRNSTTFDTPSIVPSEAPNNNLTKYMAIVDQSPSMAPEITSNGPTVPSSTVSMTDTTTTQSPPSMKSNDTESVEYADHANETSIESASVSNVTDAMIANSGDGSNSSLNATEVPLNLTETSSQNDTDSLMDQNSTTPSQVSPSDLINTVNGEALAAGDVESALSNATMKDFAEQGNSTDASYSLDQTNATLGNPDVIIVNSTHSSSNETSEESVQADSVDSIGEDKAVNGTALNSVETNGTTTLAENDQTGSPDSNLTATEPSSENVFSWDDHDSITTGPSVSPSPSDVVSSASSTRADSFSPSTSPETSESFRPSVSAIDIAGSVPTVSPVESNVTGSPDISGTYRPVSVNGMIPDGVQPTPSPGDSLSNSPTSLRGGEDRAAPSVVRSGDPTVPPSLVSQETSTPTAKPPTLVGGASSLISNLLHHAKATKETTRPSPSPSTDETPVPSVISTGGSASTSETLVPTMSPSVFSNSTIDNTDITEILSGFWNGIKTKFGEKCPATDDCDLQGFSGSRYHAIAFGQCLEFCGVGKAAQVLGWKCGTCPVVEQGSS